MTTSDYISETAKHNTVTMECKSEMI